MNAARLTALVVDDDPDLMAMTAEMFDMLGYDVVAADSAAAALEILRTLGDRVRLIFTDIVMPEMDGLAFADTARNIAPHALILYTSGQTAAGDAATFVPKPYTMTSVNEAIQRALATRGAPAEP